MVGPFHEPATKGRAAGRIVVWAVVLTAGVLAVVGALTWGAAALVSGAALVAQMVVLGSGTGEGGDGLAP